MRIVLKILLTSLLLVLIIAVGAEVVALHHSPLPDPLQSSPPVVVRKAEMADPRPKTVRPIPNRRLVSPVRRKASASPHKKSPAS